MNQLEEYVSNNAAAFDSGVLPEGAEERFLARWDAARRRRRVAIPFAALAVAASLAAVLFIQGTGTRDWLRKAEQTPEGIYSGYLAAVSSVWEKVGEDEEASETLAILTEETVPLGEQLPQILPFNAYPKGEEPADHADQTVALGPQGNFQPSHRPLEAPGELDAVVHRGTVFVFQRTFEHYH